MLLVVAILLSGLSIEVANSSTYGTQGARIYGPNATSFKSRMWATSPEKYSAQLDVGTTNVSVPWSIPTRRSGSRERLGHVL
jgi:hypothetical protein